MLRTFPMLLCLAAVGQMCVPAISKPKASVPGFEIVQITNTGSTNTMGYRILIPLAGADYGSVSYYLRAGMVSTGQDGSKVVPKSILRKLARDIHKAMPLSQLPVNNTAKSASFGTSLYVMYHGQSTLDLSSPADARGKALAADVKNIVATLGLTNLPRRTLGH
jgi:hypothetical protein